MAKDNPTIYQHSFKSPMGVIHTAATDQGLLYIGLPGSKKGEMLGFIKKNYDTTKLSEKGTHNLKAEKQLKQYLNGKLKKFDLKLIYAGTEFQKKALKKVAAIPYGKTKTYGQVAAALNNPNAYRAVGSANACNNLPLVVPCHRVVATNGLGGYAGGLKMKEKLLALERNNSK